MVAAERMSRIQAENRLKETEENLAAAESAVRDMQLHLQSLPTASTSHQRDKSTPSIPRRYLSSHLPYTEYQSFVQHLRTLRPIRESSKAMFPPPIIANLLTQAFLARAITEDHDPTLRLDASPELSWLSRRSVSSAVIAGDLLIEPVSASSVIYASTTPVHDIGCSLCGKPVFPSTIPPSPTTQFGAPPIHPTAHRTSSGGRFSLKPFFNTSTTNSTATTSSPSSPTLAHHTQTQSPLASPARGSMNSGQHVPVYIFRIAKPSSEKEAKAYPLCKTGWCLERLRATCELWHFVRNGLILPIWHGDDGGSSVSQSQGQGQGQGRGSIEEVTTPNESGSVIGNNGIVGDAPELPPRKSGWGLGFKLGKEGSSSGGGGWTRGWSSSGSNKGKDSPPVSPGFVEEGKKLEENVIVDAEGKGKEDLNGLGAPLELGEGGEGEGVRKSGESIVPEIQEIASSPISNPTPAQTDNSALLPTPLRVGSSTSLSLSTSGGNEEEEEEGDGFHTPKAESPELSSMLISNTDAHQVELNSPVVSTTQTIVSPPPIPKRAAARDSPRNNSPARNPARVGQGQGEKEEEKEEGIIQPVDLDERAQGIKRQSAPPLLPPRHPRTPTTQVHDTSAVEGEKSFAKGDAWEVKTWRQVVKLKEEMWKFRVGVVDSEST
jgi:hypothetical protein